MEAAAAAAAIPRSAAAAFSAAVVTAAAVPAAAAVCPNFSAAAAAAASAIADAATTAPAPAAAVAATATTSIFAAIRPSSFHAPAAASSSSTSSSSLHTSCVVTSSISAQAPRGRRRSSSSPTTSWSSSSHVSGSTPFSVDAPSWTSARRNRFSLVMSSSFLYSHLLVPSAIAMAAFMAPCSSFHGLHVDVVPISLLELYRRRSRAFLWEERLRLQSFLAFAGCDLVTGVGVQARVDPAASNVWRCQGSAAPPWALLAFFELGAGDPLDSDAWHRWSTALHRWYRLRSSVTHSLCPACLHRLLAFSSHDAVPPDFFAVLDAFVVGFDPGLDTSLKHTYKANDSSPRWTDAIAAAKLQKDITRGFLLVMPARPVCQSCCSAPSTRISLLLVDKESRADAFDPALPAFNRLAWNFSAPDPVAVNSWIPLASIPDFISYGAGPKAEQMIWALLDATPIDVDVLLSVHDQPSAYRQMALPVLLLSYCCCFAPIFVDATQPALGTVRRWLQDTRLNFGLKTAGHWQHRVVAMIILFATAVTALFGILLGIMVCTDDFLLAVRRDHAVQALAIFTQANALLGHGLAGKIVDGFGDVSIWRVETAWAGIIYSAARPPSKRVPPGYLVYVLRLLGQWHSGLSIDIAALRSLQGILIWVAQISPGIRPVITPLFQLVWRRCVATRDPLATVGHHEYGTFTLPDCTDAVLTDLRHFLTQFQRYPVARFIRPHHLSSLRHLALFSDSQPGSHDLPPLGGVFVAGFYSSFTFPPSVLARATVAGRIDNNILELQCAIIALVVACLLFPSARADGVYLLSVVDSSAALGAFLHSRSANVESNRIMSFAHLYAALSDFRFSLVDRPGVRVLSADMWFADHLSRRAWEDFWVQLDAYDPERTHTRPLLIPTAILALDDLDSLLTVLSLGVPCHVARAHRAYWCDRLAPLAV